ncbi:response regulator receiver domain-containing protein [Pseudomonas sp. URIL14HWK12:I3]|uniref:response regulator n=1 Tax=unclassified Pseudomonas TaxID=196821 RepID=UPI000DAC7027|nr:MULTISPECIES: response regulator [unclassified Pseudomonas]PZW48228.1 response regulator receiver domain-containing protein [Pseudomonas sp. URIL14HWK12:I2]PZW56725.1 response regulator receiver domain-containing protein [Pseudomonas sp. URIL14HWK12:I3]
MRILIVDDDVQRRNKLVDHISEKNLDGVEPPAVAGSVDEAKALLKQCYYDILILDVVLPKRPGSAVSAENSFSLLGQISREGILKRPGQIIGVTAHKDDIGRHREEFERACAVVIEAQSNMSAWKERISERITYSLASRVARTVKESAVEVVTIHGIRTFGEWQSRLRNLVCKSTDGVEFNPYNYGYFSVVAFFFPFARDRAVRKLRAKLKSVLEGSQARHLVIFSHSFGTYLITHGLEHFLNELQRFEKVTLVLSGSVLKSDFDWSALQALPNFRVINECGDGDIVLWLSSAAVLGCGMAGKVGFYGFNNSRFANRFYKGGHSLYFEGDEFMSKKWLPIILNEDFVVSTFDERSPNVLMHGIGDQVASLLAKVKKPLYWSGSIYFIFAILSKLT